MANRKVAIYERVIRDGKKTWLPVEMPRKKPQGGLFLRDNREGDFSIAWYEGTRKRWRKVRGGCLGNAVSAAEGKSWELLHPERVKEEIPDDGRLTVGGGIYKYLEEMAGSPLTVKEHRHALEEFHRWSGTTYVDQITRAEVLRFKDWAEKKQGNDELTAVLEGHQGQQILEVGHE